MKYDVLIAGFGGQGILFTGKLLAYFGLIDGREVSWLPSYGPAMRGGTCNCSVCISDEPIGSPLILTPDLLIVMNSPSYDKFAGTVRPGGKIFVDSTLVEGAQEGFSLPATQLAIDNDLKGMANIIMLGKVLRETALCSMETVEKALERVIPPKKAHLIEYNKKAIDLGFNF